MELARAAAVLEELRAPAFRLEQLRRAVFDEAVASYQGIAVLPAQLRRDLEARLPLLSLSVRKVAISADRRARKALLGLADGKVIETVLLRPSPTRWTTCVSTQVGCAIGCTFCATGLMGLSRSLTPEEITDQVLFWRQYMRSEGLEGRLDNVVYMGMGEPFAAYESMAESLRRLLDQKQFGIGARHISVSTSGLAPQIERFARDFPQVNLALSLHSADEKLRSDLVPVNRAFPLARLSQAVGKYLSLTRRKVFLEYVLLGGENDGADSARQLVAWIKATGPRELLHVNLILFNETATRHRASTEPLARRFQALLLGEGIKATLRQNLGRDIEGACGQLVVAGGEGR
ncbi:MAG: 23S rRNA (adenine(2503)-C(2))-methyltransferase RlmN [Elusimicrobia bacterium]|nr:23S rRNA (adenine(2503)-C(2))-methyltransferase RlmN [Elusimicrobiota bacterium]MDE2425408.1 23S rRNA (adenine(2503)-C(2))-methyltransferase RlmN [Elusimicrobiota bacterium]